MPGNSAGLIRAHRTLILPANTDTYTYGVCYASGTAPSSATSLIYPNDRYLLADGAGFSKWTFNVAQTSTLSGVSISFYYTNDRVTASGLKSFAGTGIWNLMAAPSENSGTGATAGAVLNPITNASGGSTGSYMQFSGGLLAYRIVTNNFTGGNVEIDILGLP